MPPVVATCSKCSAQFSWNTDFQEMPDCPNCGHNPNRQFQNAGIANLITMLRSGDRYESSNAAAQLGDRGDRSAVEPLIHALQNNDAKLAATIALGKLRDERAVQPLLKVLKEGSGPSRSAAEALAKIGSPQALTALFDNAEASRDGLHDAMGVLVCKGDSAIEHLLAALQHGNSSVRGQAAWALGQMGDQRAVAPLIALLQDKQVRDNAARSLGLLGDERAVESLVALLKDDDGQTQRHVTMALTKLGWKPQSEAEQIPFYEVAQQWDRLKAIGQPATEHFIGILKFDGSFKRRQDAAAILDKMNWVPENEQDRIEYSLVTGKLDGMQATGAAAVDALIQALRDQNYQYRKMVPAALAATCNARAVDAMIDALNDDQADDFRSEVAKSLGKLRDIRAVESLIAALDDSNDRVRRNCAEALGNIKDLRAVDALISLMSRESGDPALAAVEALEKIRDVRAVEPLILALKDRNRDRYFQSKIIKALGRIGDRAAVQPLCTVLRSGNVILRSDAVTALGQIGDQQAVKPLVKFGIRETSEALVAIGQPAVEELTSIASSAWQQEYRRKDAVDVIRRITGKKPQIEEKFCFIATAAMGSANHSKVCLLRQFRDDVLLEHRWGRGFVRVYYACSPPLARLIERSEMLKWSTRILVIQPLASIVERILNNLRS